MSSEIPMPKWLSGPTFHQWVLEDKELLSAYDWPDYPGEMVGDGNWVDVFVTETDDFIIGRLWVNPEANSVGLEFIEGGDLLHFAKAALTLREFYHHGVDALQAYEYIKREFYCGEEETGELKDAVLSAAGRA